MEKKMQKRINRIVSMVLIAIFCSFSLTSCYGKFNLTKKLYNWNGNLGDKWINSIMMIVLMIVPAYSIAGFVDVAILNVIEFWTGDNPVAMNEGEKETKFVEMDGENYEITATKNRFDVKNLETGKEASLLFNAESQSWFVETNGTQTRVAQYDDENTDLLALINPDGKLIEVNVAE